MKTWKFTAAMCLMMGAVTLAVADTKVVSKDPPAVIAHPQDGKTSDEGTVVGKVKELGKAYVVVLSESGQTARYIPEWKGNASGGPDNDIVKCLATLKVGDRVSLKWYVNDHIRIKQIDVLH